jgi:hypothetical protein
MFWVLCFWVPHVPHLHLGILVMNKRDLRREIFFTD